MPIPKENRQKPESIQTTASKQESAREKVNRILKGLKADGSPMTTQRDKSA